jgi:hypothetical protein
MQNTAIHMYTLLALTDTNTQLVWCLYVANSTAFDFLSFILCANCRHVSLKVVLVIEVLHNSVLLFCMKHGIE